MVNMPEEIFVELNGGIYPNPPGHVLGIYSVALARLLSKPSNQFKFKISILGTKFVIERDENGIRPQIWRRQVRFYLNKSYNLSFESYSKAKLLIIPKEFGATYYDLGLIPREDMGRLLTQSPTIWVDCYIDAKPQGFNVSFSADRSLSGKYCVLLAKDEAHLLLRGTPPIEHMVNQRRGIVRKISPSRENRLCISTPVFRNIKAKRLMIGIFKEDWESFDISSCFTYEKEKELACELFQRGMILYSTHSVGYFDIGVTDKNGKLLSAIEVTNGNPKKKSKRGMFSEVGSRITAKVQSLRIWSIKNSAPSFVVLPST